MVDFLFIIESVFLFKFESKQSVVDNLLNLLFCGAPYFGGFLSSQLFLLNYLASNCYFYES